MFLSIYLQIIGHCKHRFISGIGPTLKQLEQAVQCTISYRNNTRNDSSEVWTNYCSFFNITQKVLV